MTLATDLSKQIETYISDHPQCGVKRIQVLEIAGKRQELEVYSLPTNLLRYNIRNSRFAAEYREMKSKLGRNLDCGRKNRKRNGR